MTDLWAFTSAYSRISLHYEQDHDWLYMKWCGHINPDDVVVAARAYVDVQQEKKCPKLLNDKSEVTGDWQEANDWLQYEWFPQVMETGLRYFAMVLSRDMHDQASAQDLQQRLSGYCNVRLFDDLSEARQWLDSQPTPNNAFAF